MRRLHLTPGLDRVWFGGSGWPQHKSGAARGGRRQVLCLKRLRGSTAPSFRVPGVSGGRSGSPDTRGPLSEHPGAHAGCRSRSIHLGSIFSLFPFRRLFLCFLQSGPARFGLLSHCSSHYYVCSRHLGLGGALLVLAARQTLCPSPAHDDKISQEICSSRQRLTARFLAHITSTQPFSVLFFHLFPMSKHF
jgi:hypothetical protein